jgi:hypothetical protein
MVLGHRSVRGPSRLLGALFTGLLVLVLLVLFPGFAWAHGEDENAPAYDLVRQAIALIVNTPDDHEAIEDKVHDALEAEDTSRVTLSYVQQAMDALDADNMDQARSELEAAIGARVYTGPADPVPIGGPAPPPTGADTGTVAAVDGIPGRAALSGGDRVLIVVSVVAGAAGVLLAIRPRPHESDPQAATR